MTHSNSRRSFFKKAALTAGAFAPLATFASGLETALDKSPKMIGKPSDLKITEVKCGYIRNGHSLFVKIYTNQDIWGCGEGVDAIPGTYYLVKNFGARLKGKNPLNVHRLFEDIRRSGLRALGGTWVGPDHEEISGDGHGPAKLIAGLRVRGL